MVVVLNGGIGEWRVGKKLEGKFRDLSEELRSRRTATRQSKYSQDAGWNSIQARPEKKPKALQVSAFSVFFNKLLQYG
jgi:hypothetical protein